MKIVFTLCIVFLIINKISCGCRKSYATICDTISDYETYKDVKSTEVFINGSSTRSSSRRSVHMVMFGDVISLTIIRQLNGIVPEKSCFGHSALKFVNLYDNILKKLEAGSFPRLSKIYKLALVNNKIESIQARTFAYCQPEIIDLSNNKLEFLETYTFTSPLTENATKVIILENNKLVTVQRYTFPSELRLLNLNKNSISFLEKEVFEGLTKLETLVLSRNKFSSLPNTAFLTNLKLLDISYNRIDKLHGRFFGNRRNLEFLDLSHNKVSEIHGNTFAGFQNLATLDLSHNQIQKVDFLAPIHKNWVQVSLAFNLLKEMKFGGAPSVKLSTVSVTLYGNPWRCPDWIFIERDLIDNEVKRDPCDVELFNSGQLPFCLCYETFCTFFPENNATRNVHRDLSVSEPYVEREFLDTIKNNKNLKKCGFLSREQFRKYVIYNPSLTQSMCE